jgi:hypothetical protein
MGESRDEVGDDRLPHVNRISWDERAPAALGFDLVYTGT